MTSEQLLATRATLWRQKAEPLLTLDDAQSWLRQSGLCLFLPRKAQISAPAPSFVEACLGETNPVPPRAAIETAKNLLGRMIESNSVVPLNLLGTAADYPDFLVAIEALPFVYALRGDRDWKRAPGGVGANRVSVLVVEVWKLLERRGVLSVPEIQAELGRELTGAAVLRALHDLWASLRVVPLYQSDGQETLWEPLQSRHQKAIASGAGTSQVTALSVLVSVYLQSAVAASSEDAESFLSPLASRSKVREVVRGLTATRQLALIQMETQSLLFLEGSLPEFPEAEKPSREESITKSTLRRSHWAASGAPHNTANTPVRPAFPRNYATTRPDSRPATGGDFGSSRPLAAKREAGNYRPVRENVRPSFKARGYPPQAPDRRAETRSPEGSVPGSGLRPDGTPKKTRWRNLPGGRPDQKGKPARFGPRRTEGAPREEAGRPSVQRRPEGLRPARAGAKTPYPRNAPPKDDKKFRPPSRGPFRPAASGSRPPFRPISDRSATGPATRPPFRPSSNRAASRPPSRPGSDARRPSDKRPFSRPRRDDGFRSGERRSTSRFPSKPGMKQSVPRSSESGRFSPPRPRPAPSQYSPRPRESSDGKPFTARPPFGKPPGKRPAGKTSDAFGAAKRPWRPFGKPGSSPQTSSSPSGRKRTGRSVGARPASDPGSSQHPRPGINRPGQQSDRFRKGPRGSAGRPPAKFKKRAE